MMPISRDYKTYVTAFRNGQKFDSSMLTGGRKTSACCDVHLDEMVVIRLKDAVLSAASGGRGGTCWIPAANESRKAANRDSLANCWRARTTGDRD